MCKRDVGAELEAAFGGVDEFLGGFAHQSGTAKQHLHHLPADRSFRLRIHRFMIMISKCLTVHCSPRVSFGSLVLLAQDFPSSGWGVELGVRKRNISFQIGLVYYSMLPMPLYSCYRFTSIGSPLLHQSFKISTNVKQVRTSQRCQSTHPI